MLDNIVEVRVPRIKVGKRSGDEPWFDEFSIATFRYKQAAHHLWRSLRTPANWVLLRESQREANAG